MFFHYWSVSSHSSYERFSRHALFAIVCALNGKFSKSSLNKESPEGASPLCTGVTPGSISKWQGGLG